MILENIAKAIRKSDKTRYRIWQETGVSQAVLCHIVTGGGGRKSCSIKTADLLCKYLGLELVKKQRKGR